MAEPQGPFLGLTLPLDHAELQLIEMGVLLEEEGKTRDLVQYVL